MADLTCTTYNYKAGGFLDQNLHEANGNQHSNVSKKVVFWWSLGTTLHVLKPCIRLHLHDNASTKNGEIVFVFWGCFWMFTQTRGEQNSFSKYPLRSPDSVVSILHMHFHCFCLNKRVKWRQISVFALYHCHVNATSDSGVKHHHAATVYSLPDDSPRVLLEESWTSAADGLLKKVPDSHYENTHKINM